MALLSFEWQLLPIYVSAAQSNEQRKLNKDLLVEKGRN